MDSELYEAVVKDNIDVLKAMEHRISKQRTPANSTILTQETRLGLHLAARHGHYQVVVELINKAKSPITQPNYLQYTTSTMLQSLIRTENVELETALHAAVRYDHENVAQVLLKEDPCQPHHQNKYKETPLYIASVRLNNKMIRVILDNSILPPFDGPNQRSALRAIFGGPDGRTALHAAVLDGGGHECVKLLLEKSKNLITIADNHGWTAFHFVAHSDQHKLVKDLVSAGKYVGYRRDKRHKRTPLHVAAYDGNVEVMAELAMYYPDCWEILDGRGRNILHIALEQDKKSAIDFILSRGGFAANNNLLIQRNDEGDTPLHLLAKLGCYVPQLMNKPNDYSKVDWEVINDKNLTPLDVLHCRQDTDTNAHKIRVAIIRRTLIEGNIRQHWNLSQTQKEPDLEMGSIFTRHRDKTNQERVNEIKEVISAHMIVAALIATIALTAGFTMPGGFNENKGYPNLLRKAAFKAFMVTDTIALLSSVSALLLYFVTTFTSGIIVVNVLIISSASLNVIALIAMMLTFGTGTYAVLAPSSALAISVCVLSSFLPVVFFIMFRPFFRRVFFIMKKNWSWGLPRRVTLSYRQ